MVSFTFYKRLISGIKTCFYVIVFLLLCSGNVLAETDGEIYNIKYLDENNAEITDLVANAPKTWTPGESINVNIPVKEDWSFNGWFKNTSFTDLSNRLGTKDAVLTIDDNFIEQYADKDTQTLTLYGQLYPKSVFWITTTSTNYFKYYWQAEGTIWTDWGDGVVEKMVGANGPHYFEHKYSNSGVYRIGLSSIMKRYRGGAGSREELIEYLENNNWWRCVTTVYFGGPGYSWSDRATGIYIAKVEGSIGKVFPTLLHVPDYTDKYPSFCSTFIGTTNWKTEIPEELFDGIEEYSYNMFAQTFRNSGVTGKIPQNLFNKIQTKEDTIKSSLFRGTFNGCTGLEGEIPDNLFASVSGQPEPYMFMQTFSGCSGLTGKIPDNLFSNIAGAPAERMFTNTFDGTSISGPLPENLFAKIEGPAKTSIYDSTFANTKVSGEVPENFFGNITSIPSEAENAFNKTFMGTQISGEFPEHLFESLPENTAPTANLFQMLFSGTNLGLDETGTNQSCIYGPDGNRCFIPKNIFSKISRTATATNQMTEIFKDTKLLDVCPDNFYQYKTGFEQYYTGKVSCDLCSEISDEYTLSNASTENGLPGNSSANYCYRECDVPEGYKEVTPDYLGYNLSQRKADDWNITRDRCYDIITYNIKYMENTNTEITGITEYRNSADETVTGNNPTEFTVLDNTTTLLTPVKTEDGTEYIGIWYLNPDYIGNAVTELSYEFVKSNATDETVKLYVKWQIATITCPVAFPLSDGNATTTDQCYTQCNVSNAEIEHATSVSGKLYSTGLNQCNAEKCETGYHKETWSLTKAIETNAGTNYAYITNSGSFVDSGSEYGDAVPQSFWNFGEDDKSVWGIKFGNKGIVKGQAQCSSQPGDNQDWTWTNPTIRETLKDEANDIRRYCYCNVTGYKPDGTPEMSLSSPWVLFYGFNSASDCDDCAYACAFYGTVYAHFRAVLFGNVDGLSRCEINTYTISWKDFEGDELEQTSCEYNGAIKTPGTEPSKKGYTFLGWKILKKN